MLIADLLHQGKTELEKRRITTADLDTQLLLGHCLGKGRTELFLDAASTVSTTDCVRFWSLIRRRFKHEPVAYLLGEREFWSLPFHVNRDVLIPRPETEFLLETVLQIAKRQGFHVERAMDLCCGSGVIAVVLAKELGIEVIGVDISEKALAVCAMNCRRHRMDTRISLVCADLFTGFSSTLRVPLIVSNPPYVGRNEMSDGIAPEVVDYEPCLALDGGQDGLDIIRRIAAGILGHLSPGGLFFMEFGADHAAAVLAAFSSVKCGDRYFIEHTIFKDYSGRDRVLYARVNHYSE